MYMEDVMTTQTKSIETLEVVFDNGGGITVQCDGFTGNFDDPKVAAENIKAILDGDNAADWDSNLDAQIQYTQEEIGNGGYRVFDAGEISATIASGTIDSSWHNVRDVFAALGVKVEG
jgi:hypothetical protein